MKPHRDLLIRMAGRIHRHLSRPTPAAASNWETIIHDLLGKFHNLENHWRLARHANSRGWYAAATAKEQDLRHEAHCIETAAGCLHLEPWGPSFVANAPTLGMVVAELHQLQEEFEDFEIDLKTGIVTVSTDRIVLEDIDLRPFSIELHLSRLGERLDSQCFNCVALEPNPAEGNNSVTHPHVQDDRLCAGDATTPISVALREGRLAQNAALLDHQSSRRQNQFQSIGGSPLNKVALNNLNQFTGTEHYYRHLGIQYTDGIKFLAENAECDWLLDAIGSYQPGLNRNQRLAEFQLWELKVAEGGGFSSAVLTCTDGDSAVPVITQDIEQTDFPLPSIRLYVENGVLLLPSEH
jgi:hypothetical protein